MPRCGCAFAKPGIGRWSGGLEPRTENPPQDLHWRGSLTRCARCSGCDLLSSGGCWGCDTLVLPVCVPQRGRDDAQTPVVRFFEVQASCVVHLDQSETLDSILNQGKEEEAQALMRPRLPEVRPHSAMAAGRAGTGTAPDLVAISAACHRGSSVLPRIPCGQRRIGYLRTGH